MNFKFVDKVNWLNEAVALGNLLYEIETLEEIDELHISKEPEKYSIPLEELDKEFEDILNYKKECIRDAFKEFKKDREIQILTTPYSSTFSDFTILMSISWFLKDRDLEKISKEEFFQAIMLALYSDAVNDVVAEGEFPENIPHIKEFRFNNSKWTLDDFKIETQDIMTLLGMTNYSEEIKWTVLELIFNEEKRNSVFNKIVKLQNIIKNHIHLVEERFNNSNEMHKNSEEYSETINDLFGKILESFEDIHHELNIINYNVGAFKAVMLKEIPNTLYVGIIMKELMDKSGHFEMNDENVIEKCKAIGDSTRFRIINNLSEKSMYVKELADILELSSATLSHHLNILMKNGFLEVRVEDIRTYYSLKKETFEELGQYFQMKANTLRRD